MRSRPASPPRRAGCGLPMAARPRECLRRGGGGPRPRTRRCRAAVESCHEEGILLLARADARTSRGFDEALARLKAFVAEGADILFFDSPQSEAEMRESVAAA